MRGGKREGAGRKPIIESKAVYELSKEQLKALKCMAIDVELTEDELKERILLEVLDDKDLIDDLILRINGVDLLDGLEDEVKAVVNKTIPTPTPIHHNPLEGAINEYKMANTLFPP
jgi:hypothetical protein